MKRPPSTTWVCPVCGRRVPRREAECFCGAKQVAVDAQVEREASRSGARVPLDVAGLVLLLVLVGVYAAHRLMSASDDDPFAEKARRALGGALGGAEIATPPSTLRPSPSATPRPTPVPGPPASEAAAPELAVSTAARASPPATTGAATPAVAATAAPAPTPTPEDERDKVRAAGLRQYQDDLDGLLASAQRLAEHVRVYKADCVSTTQRFGARISNCPEIESAIRSRAGEIQRALDAAEDQARRAWLQPGAVRDTRARTFFGTREWEDLQRSAGDLKKP